MMNKQIIILFVVLAVLPCIYSSSTAKFRTYVSLQVEGKQFLELSGSKFYANATVPTENASFIMYSSSYLSTGSQVTIQTTNGLYWSLTNTFVTVSNTSGSFFNIQKLPQSASSGSLIHDGDLITMGCNFNQGFLSCNGYGTGVPFVVYIQPDETIEFASNILSVSSGYISGWACAKFIPFSINLRLYVGGSFWRGGTFIGHYQANQTSSVQAAIACSSTGTNYGFQIYIDTLGSTYSGQPIYLYYESPYTPSSIDVVVGSGTWYVGSNIPQPPYVPSYPEFWYAPRQSPAGPSPSDFFDQFTSPYLWPTSSGLINVFQIPYSIFVQGSSTNMTRMVRFLQTSQIALAVQMGPLQGTTSCGTDGNVTIRGFGGSTQAKLISQLAIAWGGGIDYVALDEPLYYGHCYSGPSACNYSIQTVVSQIVETIQVFQAYNPNIKVGDVEPIDAYAECNPSGWQNDVVEYITTYEKNPGFSMAFWHDDPDWNNLMGTRPALQKLLTAQGITYGMIFSGSNYTNASDAGWMSAAETNINTYYGSSSLPAPWQVIIQSWDEYPSLMLPETSPTALTYLLNYVAPHLRPTINKQNPHKITLN